MKSLMLYGLILAHSGFIYAQIKGDYISFEVRYPIPVGDNFINKGATDGYFGIVDLGVDYTILKVNNLGVGLMINSSVLKFSAFDVTLWTISPKVKIDYVINLNRIRLIPGAGFGYSNWRSYSKLPNFSVSGEPSGTSLDKTVQNALSFQAEAKVLFRKEKRINWYFEIAYEFTRLEKPEFPAEDSGFNRNIQLLYPGIGMIWMLKKE
jgi:hypothetical protein